MRRRRLLGSLLLALLVLAGVDQFVRPAYPLAGRGFFIEHPLRFWTLRKGTDGLFDGSRVRVNQAGFRGEEVEARQPGEVRILLLGDSCTFGDRVDQTGTLDRWLERGLEERTGRRVRVYNAGIPGYSSFQGVRMVREVAPLVGPDIVVEAYFYADRSRDMQADHERLPPPPLDQVRRFFWESGLYRMLRARVLGQGTSIDLSQDRLRPERGRVDRVSPERMEENLVTLSRESGARHTLFLLLPARMRPAGPGDPWVLAVERASSRSPGGRFLNLHGQWADLPASRLDRRFYDEIHPTALGFQALAEELLPILAPWVEEAAGDGGVSPGP